MKQRKKIIYDAKQTFKMIEDTLLINADRKLFWLIEEQVGVWSDVGTNYGFFKTTYPISGITKHAMEFV